MKKHKVLYISYDGMTDPLGQSQVLSYLRLLSRHEYSFHLLSFEKPERFAQQENFVREFIKGHDIHWHPLEYTNKPPIISTVNNIRKGKQKIAELIKENDFSIVHCRGYVPSIMGEWVKKKTGAKFIFDMRGFWADEKKEAGDWSRALFKPVYNYFKKRELGFFRNCDLNVSLTHAGKEYIVKNGLRKEDGVTVIPTCVNFEVFPPFDAAIRQKHREALNIPLDSPVMIYSGSLGGNYRTDLVLVFFKHMLKMYPNAYFLFITHSPESLANQEIADSGIDPTRFRRVKSTYSQVHQYLMVGDVGVVIYNAGFSVIGRSPTKLGEYWGSGLKCLSVKGIGDLDFLLEKYPAGGRLAASTDRDADMEQAVKEVMGDNVTREELRRCAVDYFDLQQGCDRYLANYRKLVK